MLKFQEIYPVFLQLKKSIFHFLKKIKVGGYNSRTKEITSPIKFEIRFIDSSKFLQTSLANLVSNLQPTDFKNLNRVIKENTSLLTIVIHMIMFHRLIFSKKPNFHRKNVFIQSYMMNTFQMKTINMLSKSGILSIVKH